MGKYISLQGAVSRKPRKLFGLVKPVFVHLCLKTEKCICLKLLVTREPHIKNTSIKQLRNHKGARFCSTTFRARKVSGAFKKWPPEQKYFENGQCKTQAADCRLQTGGKMQTAVCRPRVKCRLRVK